MARFFLFLFMVGLCVSGCSEKVKFDNDNTIPVTGIILNPSEAILAVGYSLTMDVAVEPVEAVAKTMVWSTDNEQIATVDAAGKVTAVAPGTAIITATTDDGRFSAISNITIAEEGVITMTTQASELSINIYIPAQNDNITIDWGDGEKSYINDAEYNAESDGVLYLDFSHNYTRSSAHKITIIGVVKTLYCNYNQLTELDVSQNIWLEYLFCGVNQLTELDMSKNTALNELHCGANQLTKLDVSRNVDLHELRCYNNQLTTLDVSSAAALRNLYCGDNQLTELNMSKNTELQTLNCSNNQLTTAALNDLFGTLRSFHSYTRSNITHQRWLSIPDNPGTNDCDIDIAEEKGWIVLLSYEHP